MLKNMTASEIKRMTTDGKTVSEFNYIRVRQIVKKIIYGVKFIWISIGNLDPTIIFVILEWLLLVYWSRSISLVFLIYSPWYFQIPLISVPLSMLYRLLSV